MTESTSDVDPAVVIDKCAFTPTVLHVEPGTKVAWTNKDIFDHTVSGANGSWGNETALAQGDVVAYRFDDPGTYPYYCAFHPGMTGSVVVGDGKGAGAGGSAAGPFDPVVVSAFEPAEPEAEVPTAPASDDEGGLSSLAIVGLCALMLAGGYGLRSLRVRTPVEKPQTEGI
jgi:plastocyanin